MQLYQMNALFLNYRKVNNTEKRILILPKVILETVSFKFYLS